MTTVRNQSYAAVSHAAGAAGKLFSKAIKDTEADRKAEARKAKWDMDNSGDVSEQEAYVAEMAILSRQKAILDIILLVRDKIRQFTSSAYATRELKKVFHKYDPDGSGALSWFEFDKALKDMGVNINGDELEHLMEIFDADGDGELYWGEFVGWCDERVPLSLDKMRLIISTQAGPAQSRKGKGLDATTEPSSAYKKAWLDVHAAAVDEDVAGVAIKSRAGFSPLVGNVRLLGDGKKVKEALQRRKQMRAQVIQDLRKMITDTSGDMPLKQQLDILWARFDTNGDGIINWREFTSGMKSMGHDLSPGELSTIMKEFDTNCDGALDYVELVGHLMPTTSTSVEEDFDRLTTMRRSMLLTRGISRAGVPTPGGGGGRI
mmetsp:Transcript_28613/g.45923  ORF Transcript_28613/g.45923 Transcript_28613/m.45923 type:complete len:376 (+) Transcript_28613:76-1203(+)